MKKSFFTPFRDLPIRQKLMSLILRTSVISAIIVSVFLVGYELRWAPFEEEVERLDLIVEIARPLFHEYIFFQDAQALDYSLRALTESIGPRLVAVEFWDAGQKPLSRKTGVRREEIKRTNLMIKTSPELAPFRNFCADPEGCTDRTFIGLRSYYWVQRPVVFESKRVGTIKVLVYRDAFDATALIPGVVGFLIVLAVGYVLARRHQKRISEPIEALATAASDVALKCDYQTRVARRGADEIGHLTDIFNSMLEQIDQRERRLQQKNRELMQVNALIEQRERSLQQTNQDLLDANKRANAAMEAKSRFLAYVSHELRTPLTAIIGFAEYDVDKGIDKLQLDVAYSDLEIIYSSGKHLLHLINQLLDFSAIEAGKMKVKPEAFDLNAVLEEHLKWLRREFTRRGNTLQMEISPSLGTLVTDSKKVQQIIINLLSNANKFTEGGTITLAADVDVHEQRDFLRLRVTDTGAGIASDRLENLFQPFFTADARQEGTGLGLNISRQFAHLMGGEITVSSTLGAGSTFTVFIPTTLHATVPAEAPMLLPVRAASAERRRVLVIDDDPATRELIDRIVSPEGFDVVQAASGEEGLRIAKEQRPDMIILDVILPGMNGWSVLTTLKADPALSEIPVILLTILDDRKRAYALGATDFLVKPIESDRLLAATHRYRCPVPPSTVLIVDDDANCRLTVRKMLQHDDWNVVEAENGHAALEWLDHNEAPALILLDLIMPEMDGFRFVEEKRKRSGDRAVPVVVLTAKEMTPEERRQLRGGVDEILQKGAYTPEQFDRTVRSLVSAYGPRGGAS